MNINYRSANGYDLELASNEATIPADQQGESLTVQSQSEDADINVLMRRFGVTGKLPENPRVPEYGDFSEITDYQSALNAVMETGVKFMEFPAEIRSRFENSPQKLLEFCGDVKNIDEAIKLGLISKTRVEARQAELQAAESARQAEIVKAAKAAGLVVAPVAPAPVVP